MRINKFLYFIEVFLSFSGSVVDSINKLNPNADGAAMGQVHVHVLNICTNKKIYIIIPYFLEQKPPL